MAVTNRSPAGAPRTGRGSTGATRRRWRGLLGLRVVPASAPASSSRPRPYLGPDDAASHGASRRDRADLGDVRPRRRQLRLPLHGSEMFNIVAGPAGEAGAVLVPRWRRSRHRGRGRGLRAGPAS